MRRHYLPVLLLGLAGLALVVINASAAPKSGNATVIFTITDILSNVPISGIKVVVATDTAPKGTPGCYDCHTAEEIGVLSSKASGGRYEHKYSGATDAAGVVSFQVPPGVRILVVIKDPARMYELETLERIFIRKPVEYRFDVGLDQYPVM